MARPISVAGVRCALNVPDMGAPGALVDLAVLAETAGWDGFFVWDHLQFSRSMRLDVHDPWVILGGVAVRADRVRLGTMVTPVARRRPWKLAKEVITLDHLSNGRATLGVGLGSPAGDDFAAFGEVTDDRDRARRYDEGLGVVDDILRGRVVSHRGEAYEVDAQLFPAARQRPRPPIWLVESRWPVGNWVAELREVAGNGPLGASTP